jgi:hydrogenase nickel incorporation protein HypA/HybF
MHELSLVRSMFEALEAQCAPEELVRLQSIHLSIGPLANVEAILLQNAYAAVLAEEKPQYQAVRLQVREVPIVVECPQCGQRSEVLQYRFACAHCGTPTAHVVQGNELLIERIELRDG